jgi:hypothetical protein
MTAAPTVETVLAADDVRGRRLYALLFAACSLVACLPVWLVEFPPLVDYPNHLARQYVLFHYDETPAFQEHYEPAYEIVPNLAIEAFVLPLQWVLPVETAGKVFLTAVLLCQFLGYHLFGRAVHGRPTWLAFGGFFIAYHSMWLYGFINFSFGIGTFLVTAAVWLWWRPSLSLAAGLCVAALVVTCYLSHVAAFFFVTGTMLAVVAADLARQPRTWGRLALQLLPLVPGLVLYFAVGGAGGGGVVWNTVTGKVIGLLGVVMSYDIRFDAVIVVALVILLAVIAWRSRGWAAHAGVLLAGAGFLFLFLAAPKEVFTGSGADARFLAAAVPLLLLSVRFRLPAPLARWALVCFLGLTLARLGVITWEWTRASGQIAAQVALLDRVPVGARIYPAVMEPDVSDYSKRDRCCFHAVHYATIRRQAFVPTLFAYPFQQPIRLKSPPTGAGGRPLTDRVRGYDYAFCFDVPPSETALLAQYCTRIGEAGGATLYRLPTRPNAAH